MSEQTPPVELTQLSQLLVGTVNQLKGTGKDGREFLNKLTVLMQEYDVTRMDVAWAMVPRIGKEDGK